MISSESINYSKYSIINKQNSTLSSDLETNRQSNKKKYKEKSDSNSLIISDENENEDKDKLIIQNEKNQNTSADKDLLYGNKIDNLNPRFIGKCIALFYNDNGDPKVTIGPDCK